MNTVISVEKYLISSRSEKSNRYERGQYCGGRPRGNTTYCILFFFFWFVFVYILYIFTYINYHIKLVKMICVSLLCLFCFFIWVQDQDCKGTFKSVCPAYTVASVTSCSHTNMHAYIIYMVYKYMNIHIYIHIRMHT